MQNEEKFEDRAQWEEAGTEEKELIIVTVGKAPPKQYQVPRHSQGKTGQTAIQHC